DERNFRFHFLEGGDDGGGDDVAFHDAAEDVNQHRLDIRVAQQNSQGFGDLFFVGAAADVEEVGRLAAVVFDDVHGAHGQAGAVDQAADVAGEADEAQTGLASAQLGGIFLRLVAKFFDVGVAEQGVVVEADLSVEDLHVPFLGDDQRIDLGEG